MAKYKRPIRRTLLVGCILFLVLLGLLFSCVTLILSRRTLYRQYDTRLRHVVEYVEKNTDADDLRECIRTGVSSPARDALQELLNGMVDPFGLSYIYIVIPGEDGVMYNVVSSTSAAEFAAGETDLPLLEGNDLYSRQELDHYRSFWNAEDIGFFEEVSGWGDFYTACKPLRDSGGETVALLCADIPIHEVHASVRTSVLIGLALMLLAGAVFIALLLRWLHVSVTGPVLALEERARQFADVHRGEKSLEQLSFDPPVLKYDNELRSLSNSIAQLSEDVKRYVSDIFSAEARARSAELEAEDMTRIAYQDPLTHVKSKAAYMQESERLDREIADGKACFALVMVDLNNLKQTNDVYGHENGDKYLIGTCSRICTVFKHSPVFRVGGDEFVVVLRGQDFENRIALCDELREDFRVSAADESRVPWERYVAAVGLADYTGAPGELTEHVYARADEQMYADKSRIKSGR